MGLDLDSISFFDIKDDSVNEVEHFVRKVGLSVESLRRELELAGKRAGLYIAVSDYDRGRLSELSEENEEHDPYLSHRLSQVISSEKEVIDLMGYLNLFQMDVTSSLVSLLEAKNDTERIVVSKHAYTIIHEALDTDLFRRVSRDMLNLPDVLLSDSLKHKLWKDIRGIARMMITKKDAKTIRDSIDAHKHGFVDQMNSYGKCSYYLSVVNLVALFKILDVLQKAMRIIDDNLHLLYDQFHEEMRERIRKLNSLMEKLKEYEGKPLPPEGLTGD